VLERRKVVVHPTGSLRPRAEHNIVVVPAPLIKAISFKLSARGFRAMTQTGDLSNG
jgi:hypothetical protein